MLRLKAPVGGRVPQSRADLEGFSGPDLCGALRLKLLALEEDARNQKNGMFAGRRWFYLFNDRLPSIFSR